MCKLENGIGQVPDGGLSLNQVDHVLESTGAVPVYSYRWSYPVTLTPEQQAQVTAILKTPYYRRHVAHFIGEVQIRKDVPGIIEVDGDIRPYDFRCRVGSQLYPALIFCTEEQAEWQQQELISLAQRIRSNVNQATNRNNQVIRPTTTSL